MDKLWAEYQKKPAWDRYQTQMGGFFYKEALVNLAANIEAVCFFLSLF
jgi:hypothetical protein